MLTPRWELRGVGRVRAVISQVAEERVVLFVGKHETRDKL
jgi:hypothetical protein